MYLEKNSLLYCWIYKAASSSWRRLFFEASNMTVPEDVWLNTAIQIFRPKENVSLKDLFANSTVSFAFVRHPFERLVSAYRDKFELATEPDQKFFSFLIPEEVKNKIKSFKQFVSYLLHISVLDYNDHWLPFWLNCNFCDNK